MSPRRHRWDRRRQARSSRARWSQAGVVLGVLGAGAAVVVALAWRDVRSVQDQLAGIRQNLQRVVDDPAALSTPQSRAATRGQFEGAVRTVEAARHRIDGSPAVSLIGVVPLLSQQRRGLLRLLDDAEVAAVTGRDLIRRVETLGQQSQLRDGNLPFAALSSLAADVDAAGRQIESLARPESGLWGSLAEARKSFNDLARSNASRLLNGAQALGTAQQFMGAGGDRRHLVAAQNNAEMRDQGMVLSYAVANFSGGKVSVEPGGSVVDLPLEEPAPIAVPPGSEEVFGFLQPNRVWQSVNATADFAWSGRAMAEMYRQATGQPIDGVIAIDIPGLAAILRVVGPVVVPGIAEPVTAENAGRILLHDLYVGLAPGSDQGPRRERLSELTEAVVARLTSGDHDVVALGRELGYAAAGGHLKAWSPVPSEEEVFERTGLGGSPASADADRTFHLAVENRTATKLDYFVKPRVRQEVELSKAGTAVVTTTVTLHNQATPGQSPSYQLGPDGVTSEPGDYIAWPILWGPAGSEQEGATPESNLMLSQRVVYLKAGESRDVTFRTIIPRAVRDGRLSLRLVPQPRLEPMDLEVVLEAPDWDVGGPATVRLPWDRVMTLTWPVEVG